MEVFIVFKNNSLALFVAILFFLTFCSLKCCEIHDTILIMVFACEKFNLIISNVGNNKLKSHPGSLTEDDLPEGS